ncbi:hypothetical protein AWZ03_014759 [Drosophila navojoa]|uniref:Uncharacterized protein n=1 Tax=Drosophila navojoa TaxID=7232 RepID=A0A484AQD3_DRONA|nr:hypothetical protein AWZ03_014759 [Drosophila navojoa]
MTTDRQTDKQTDGRTDGRTDEWTVGRFKGKAERGESFTRMMKLEPVPEQQQQQQEEGGQETESCSHS